MLRKGILKFFPSSWNHLCICYHYSFYRTTPYSSENKGNCAIIVCFSSVCWKHYETVFSPHYERNQWVYLPMLTVVVVGYFTGSQKWVLCCPVCQRQNSDILPVQKFQWVRRKERIQNWVSRRTQCEGVCDY